MLLNQCSQNLRLLSNVLGENSCTKLYEDLTDGLVTDTRSQMDRLMAGRGLHIRHYFLIHKKPNN
jgi:hypothetical protein